MGDAGRIVLPVGDAPPTPVSGKLAIYPRTDKHLYIKDDTGLETELWFPGIDTFLELLDTPSSYDFGKYVRSTVSGVEWAEIDLSSYATEDQLTSVSGYLQSLIDYYSDHTHLSNIGTNTHAQIDSHITDLSIHREIDDDAFGATDLWSAEKISSMITTLSGAFDEHNEMNNIQGGAPDDYYHLTSAQHTDLTDSGNCSIHKHDDRYYTESEVDSILTGYSQVGHTHVTGDITGLEEYIEDTMGASIVGGDNITVIYNDSAGTVTISGSAGGGTSVYDDLSCLQIRRTTSHTFSTSWSDITFDTTDIENRPSVIEHDNTNTDRILIKEDGYYKVTYTVPVEYENAAEFKARFRKNDATQIPGSYTYIEDTTDSNDDTHGLTNCFIVELSSGDFITLQLDADCDPDDGYARPDVIVTVIKLDGAQGEKGDPGTGSTIIVKDDGSQVNGQIDTLNFINCTVEEGTVSGTVDVSVVSTPVFGSEFYEDSSDGQSSTNSTSWQEKLQLTTGSLPSGKYRIGWYYEWRFNNTSYDFMARVQINNSITLMTQDEETKDPSSWHVASGFYYHTGSGVLNIDLDYKSENYYKTAYIKRARLEIWRIS